LALPVVGAAAVCALVVGLAQTRGAFTLRFAAPQASFGWSGGDALVARARVLLVVAVAAWVIVPALPDIVRLAGARPLVVLDAAGVLLGRLLVRAAVALAVLGAVDLWRRVRAHERALRPTRREAERERREEEGDDRVKAERARRQRQGAGPRWDEAEVVIRGDDVALVVRFDARTMRGPAVVARARGGLAARLVDRAAAAGVPAPYDPALAAMLAGVEADVPEALWDAVAAVLRALKRGIVTSP
jgi:flagellar biosynthesis protein FlhB